MAVNLSPYGGVGAQFLDNSGNVLTGGKIFTYAAGTTTNQATYTTSAGNIPHSNPIILDASGRVPSGGEIWLTDGLSYKFILRDSNDVLIATYDNVTGINSNFVNFTNEQEIQTATAGQTVFNLTTTTYSPGTNSLSVFVDGVNQYGPGAQYAYLETDGDTVTFVNGLHVGASVKFSTSQLNSSGAAAASQVSFTGFKSQTGTVQDLADDDGSDWIGFEQAGAGAVAISAQDKMRQTVSVTDFGVVGNGVADDTVAIQAAYDATAIGGTLIFPTAEQYLITSKLVFGRSVNVDFGNSTVILNNSVFPNNRTFDLIPAGAGITDAGRVPTNTTWTQTIGLGVNTFIFTNTFAVGDTIAIALGTDPYDANEGNYVRVCKIISASSSQISVDIFTPYAINGTTHRITKIPSPINNVTIKNLVIDYVDGTTPDVHCWIGFVSNVILENISAIKSRILLNPFASVNLEVKNINATVIRAGISSHGRVFTGWQLENTSLENIAAYGTDNEQMFFLESWCRGVRIKNIQLHSTNASQTNPLFFVSGGSYDIEFDNAVFSPAATIDVLNSGGTPADYRFKQLRLIKPTQFLDLSSVESFADVTNSVSYMNPVPFVQNKIQGTVGASASKIVTIGSGIMRRLWVYIQSTTDLTAVYFRKSDGGIVAITSQIVADQWIQIDQGSQYGTLFSVNNFALPIKSIQIVTGASFPAGQNFAVVAEYFPVEGNASTFNVISSGL
jgi:hypothetical protein